MPKHLFRYVDIPDEMSNHLLAATLPVQCAHALPTCRLAVFAESPFRETELAAEFCMLQFTENLTNKNGNVRSTMSQHELLGDLNL